MRRLEFKLGVSAQPNNTSTNAARLFRLVEVGHDLIPDVAGEETHQFTPQQVLHGCVTMTIQLEVEDELKLKCINDNIVVE